MHKHADLPLPTGHPQSFSPPDFPGAVQHSRHSQRVTRETKPVAKASASDKGRKGRGSQKPARGRKKPSQKQLKAKQKQRAEAKVMKQILASDTYKTVVACDVEKIVNQRMRHLKVDVVFKKAEEVMKEMASLGKGCGEEECILLAEYSGKMNMIKFKRQKEYK